MTFHRGPVDPNRKIISVPLWQHRDRIHVLQGEHAGRTGTVIMLPSDPLARYVDLEVPNVKVALDGEPGQVATGPGAIAKGGRGGTSIVIACDDLTPYDGPPANSSQKV